MVVADAWQRRGIATRLLAALRECAANAGIRRLAIVSHADNRQALALLRRFAPDARPTVSGGFMEATVPVGRP